MSFLYQGNWYELRWEYGSKNPMIGLLDPSEAILDYVSYENTLDSNALVSKWLKFLALQPIFGLTSD